jgi:Fis family transcriptional regulator, factor for inversion stimulation protein
MKTLAAFETEADGWEGLTVVRADRGEPLSACVRTAMRQYLRGLDGHEVNDLYRLVIEEVERPLLLTVLEHTRGNQTLAARLLGISRSTLRKRLGIYKIGDES